MPSDYDILVGWTVAMLPRIKAEGVLMVPDNSPLSSEEVVRALNEIAEHPNYKSQTVNVPDRDGVRSILRRVDGDVEVLTNAIADDPHPRVMPDGAAIFIREGESDERT